MSVVYHQAQKQRYRVTLEFDVLNDFDPHNMDWEKTFELEPAETVSAYVEDLSRPDRWQSNSYWALALTPSGPLKVSLQCKGHSRPATDPTGIRGHKIYSFPAQFITLFFVIMSKSVILSLLARGNTGNEILTILDTIVSDIEQENIDDVAAYFAAL